MDVLSSRILLRPRDLEASIRFYARQLRLPVYREWGEGEARGVVFFLGGGFLELSGGSTAPAGELVQIWLQVRDLEAVLRELAATGIEPCEPAERRPWGLVEAAVRDPDGVRIVLVEVPDDHPLRRRA